MVNKTGFTLLLLVAAVVLQASAWSSDADGYKALPKKNVARFTTAKIHLEQNYTDGDTEVVIEAKGGDVGLRNFWVLAPDGKVVYQFDAPNDGRNIGAREIIVESPEPADASKILAAYPKGTYRFIGKAFDGQWFASRVDLEHNLPSPVTISFPGAGTTVSRYSLTVIWEPVSSAASYIIELKNITTGQKLTAQIPGGQNSFRAPPEWVAPGTEYQVEVVVVNASGNKTSSEHRFLTAQD